VKKFNEFVNEDIFSMKKGTNKYMTIWKLLNYSILLGDDYPLFSTWCKCVASAVYLEEKFKSEVKLSSKEIYQNLDGLDKWEYGGRSELLKWCSDSSVK